MSLVTENYNCLEFQMSQDNLPLRTLISEAERKRLRRERKLLKSKLFARRNNERDRDR